MTETSTIILKGIVSISGWLFGIWFFIENSAVFVIFLAWVGWSFIWFGSICLLEKDNERNND